MHLPDCLHRRYWPSTLPLSCQVVENRSAVLGPPHFCRANNPKYLQQFVSWVYLLPCDKVWLSSVVWSACAKAMKRNADFYVSFRRYRPLTLPLSCEVIEKGGFRPPICRGGDTPDFGYAFSNLTQFRACDRFWLSSVQWARRERGEKKKKERKKNPSKT